MIKTEAYGPQIRGGESSCTVRVSARPIYSQADAIDAIVIFSWADFARFRSGRLRQMENRKRGQSSQDVRSLLVARQTKTQTNSPDPFSP